MNGYQALANGIIEQAVKDYRDALRRLKKHPDVEEFFHSSWYGVLTQVDPDYLIDRLRKETVK